MFHDIVPYFEIMTGNDEIYDVANYLRISAVFALLVKIVYTRNCSGISGKSQVIYFVTYLLRYTDLYNATLTFDQYTVFKILHLVLGLSTVMSIFIFFRKTYEAQYEHRWFELLVFQCLSFAAMFSISSLEDLHRIFSLFLEILAIIPQILFINKANCVYRDVFYYIIALGISNCLYIVHWIYQYYKTGCYDFFEIFTGLSLLMVHFLTFIRIVLLLPIESVRVNHRKLNRQKQLEPSVPNLENGPGSVTKKNQNNAENIAISAENLDSNIAPTTLTPEMLVSHSDDKADLSKNKEVYVTF